MTWGKFYWSFMLLVVSVVLFGIPELIALFTNPANTLSEYSWAELHVGSFPVHLIAWYISLAVWLLFVVVITAHIWWRW